MKLKIAATILAVLVCAAMYVSSALAQGGQTPTGFEGELLRTEYENMTYSCFKDATGDWICNQTGGRQGRPQRTRK